MATVVTYASPGAGASTRHESATHAAIAAAIAAMRGWNFAGGYDARLRYQAPLYFVPADTLVGLGAARALGIRGEEDLFGGVVPAACVASKTVSHPLVSPLARAPSGWVDGFAEAVREVVLPGFSVFTREDAGAAGRALLARGPVRLKPGEGIGGRGQAIARSHAELDAALDALDAQTLAGCGAVLEENLEEATTYSIGRARVDGLVASYLGTQHTTVDNRGEAAYGGSDLLVVRGGLEALEALPLPEPARTALAQARTFDAATALIDGFIASRRNYDVASGRGADGGRRSGVLEQSWRIGGASGPEVAALAALQADAQLRGVHASSVERYGAGAAPPPGVIVHFHGVDPELGPLLKYTVLEPL